LTCLLTTLPVTPIFHDLTQLKFEGQPHNDDYIMYQRGGRQSAENLTVALGFDLAEDDLTDFSIFRQVPEQPNNDLIVDRPGGEEYIGGPHVLEE
jgi:hypothetical protein